MLSTYRVAQADWHTMQYVTYMCKAKCPSFKGEDDYIFDTQTVMLCSKVLYTLKAFKSPKQCHFVLISKLKR